MPAHQLVLGLGGSVDYEIAWDPDRVEALARRHAITSSELDSDLPIVDERSLLCCILAFLAAGGGGAPHL